MGKLRNISSECAAQIIALSMEHMKQSEIAHKLNLSQSSVSKVVKRYRETSSFSNKKPPGAPRCSTKQTDRMIKRMVVDSPSCSSAEIKSRLPPGVSISCRTIRRRLQVECKLRAYHPATQPRHSKKNIRDRVAFAKKYKDWTADQWSHTMFTDESIIKQFYPFRSHVRRPVGERYNSRYTVARVKHSPQVMIWGAITGLGSCGLWFLPQGETINATVYLSILQEKVPIFKELHNCTHFQQDGAPCHTARMVKNWLNSQGINCIDPWPGSSPDLNPIENCWAILKKKVAAHRPTSLPDLIQTIKQVWCTEITPEYCTQLLHSMPKRLAAVLAAKGGATKY